MSIAGIPCPLPGCDVFPFERADDMAAHVIEAHTGPQVAGDALEAERCCSDHMQFFANCQTGKPKPLGANPAPTTSGRFLTQANGFGGETTVKAPIHPDVTFGDGEDLAVVRTFLVERFSGRKLEVTDVTPNLHEFAERWLRSYTGTFEFLLDVAQDLATKGKLSLGQAKGVLNCIRADVLRVAKAVTPAEPQTTFNLRMLPESAFGILHVATRDHTTGEWVFLAIAQRRSGKVVVLQEVGGNDDLYLGQQVDGQAYRGKRVAELEDVMADPQKAITAYGHYFTRCGICNTQLTDADSIARGIGPKCAAKAGW